MTAGQCPIGNRGFPVVVNGATSTTTYTTQPNDIALQFGKNMPISYNSNTGTFNLEGSHTFFLGGSQFRVHTMKMSLYGSTNYGYAPTSITSELQIWGTPSVGGRANTDLAVLIIPIYSVPSSFNRGSSTEWLNLMKYRQDGIATNFSSVVPSNKEVIRYTTCVEHSTSDGSIENSTIAVAFWRNGFQVKSEDNIFVQQTPEFGIPLALTGNRKLFSSASEGVGANNQPVRTLSGNQGAVSAGRITSTPYSLGISASSSDFTQRIRLCIYDGESSGSRYVPTDYKCVAIDRQKDIVNGRIMIDPSTGKRLEESLTEDSTREAQLSLVEAPTMNSGDVEVILTYVFGSILGTCILALVLYLISSYMTVPTDAQVKEIADAATKLAQAPSIVWADLVIPIFVGFAALCTGAIIVTTLIIKSK
jgi:hypothetical protein